MEPIELPSTPPSLIDLSTSSPLTRPRAAPFYTSPQSRAALSPVKPHPELLRQSFSLQPPKRPVFITRSSSERIDLPSPKARASERRGLLNKSKSSSAVLDHKGPNETLKPGNRAVACHPLFDIKSKDFGRPPTVVYSRSSGEVDDLVACLKPNVPLSFDMEWPISFRKGSERKTALVQIGDGHLVVLCQISAMYYKIPPRLLAILNDPNTCKIGVNVRGDALKLQRDFGHSIRGFLDLSHLARAVDPISSGPGKSIISLQNLTAHYISRHLAKTSVRTSDWTKPLTPEAVDYSAADVYSASLIFDRLKAIHLENTKKASEWDALIVRLTQDLKAEETLPASLPSRTKSGIEAFVAPPRPTRAKKVVSGGEDVVFVKRTVVLPKGRIGGSL